MRGAQSKLGFTVEVDMKRLAQIWNAFGSTPLPRPELPGSGARALGFAPASLDVATMRIYPWSSPEGYPPASNTVIAGFERCGFFYTRRAAVRACEEWGYAD
jgi:hypothetical protein